MTRIMLIAEEIGGNNPLPSSVYFKRFYLKQPTLIFKQSGSHTDSDKNFRKIASNFVKYFNLTLEFYKRTTIYNYK